MSGLIDESIEAAKATWMIAASLTVALVRCVYEVLQYGPLQCHPRRIAFATLVPSRCIELPRTVGVVILRRRSASQLELVHLPYRLQQCRACGVLMQLLVQTSRLNEKEGSFASTASLQTVQRGVDAQLDLFQR